MTAIEKAAQFAVDKFLAEVGYCEKQTNANLESHTANAGSGNYTKYAAFFDNLRKSGLNFYNGNKNGYAWCDASFDWVQCQCWGVDTAMKLLYQPKDSCGAGCQYSADYYRANGAWYDSPSIGDQIFFGPRRAETHTGMVTAYNDRYVYTVEGNVNNRVERHTYDRSNGNISGYGRPNYALVADRFAEPTKEPDPVEPAPKTEAEQLAKLIRENQDLFRAAFEDPVVMSLEDIPEDMGIRDEVKALVDCGALKGVGAGLIKLPLSVIRAMVVMARYINKNM